MACTCNPVAPQAATDPALWVPPGPGRLIPLHRAGGTGQISPIMAVDIAIAVGRSGRVMFQYNVPTPLIPPGGDHCSDVRIEFFWDGQSVATTGWLGYRTRTPALPLQSDLYLLTGQAPGAHTLRLQPEGRDGGCNSGRLYAWDGTVLLFA